MNAQACREPERLFQSRSVSVRLDQRSRIVLFPAEGKTNGEIAERFGDHAKNRGGGGIAITRWIGRGSKKMRRGPGTTKISRLGSCKLGTTTARKAPIFPAEGRSIRASTCPQTATRPRALRCDATTALMPYPPVWSARVILPVTSPDLARSMRRLW